MKTCSWVSFIFRKFFPAVRTNRCSAPKTFHGAKASLSQTLSPSGLQTRMSPCPNWMLTRKCLWMGCLLIVPFLFVVSKWRSVILFMVVRWVFYLFSVLFFPHDVNPWIHCTLFSLFRSMKLFMSIKTTISNGLILYNGGRTGDFVAVELRDGAVFYHYNVGNGVRVSGLSGGMYSCAHIRQSDNCW